MTDAIDLLDRLVAFDTTSRRPNLDLLGFVEDRLAEHGVPARRVPSSDGARANLIARIGPAVAGGVVLSAHTDCVPVDGQPWTTDPYTLTRDGDRLLGRGTTDMKGFIAVVLSRIGDMVAADLERPVLLAFSYDEELGTVGAADLVRALVEHEPRPTAAIVGEPTRMRVVTAHKGVRSFRTVVTGRDGHSSQPQHAASAVAGAARIAAYIDGLAGELREAAADPRFEPPYTTFNLATIQGGQAINIVARRCELTWEYRPVPADDGDGLRERVERFVEDDVLPRLRETAPESEVTTEPDAVVPALAAEPDGPAEALVRRLTGSTEPAGTVPFGTDGGHFQRAGIPTVVCGPGGIEQAHQPDEYIETAQLEACGRMLDALVAELTPGAGGGGAPSA